MFAIKMLGIGLMFKQIHFQEKPSFQIEKVNIACENAYAFLKCFELFCDGIVFTFIEEGEIIFTKAVNFMRSLLLC